MPRTYWKMVTVNSKDKTSFPDVNFQSFSFASFFANRWFNVATARRLVFPVERKKRCFSPSTGKMLLLLSGSCCLSILPQDYVLSAPMNSSKNTVYYFCPYSIDHYHFGFSFMNLTMEVCLQFFIKLDSGSCTIT